MERESKRSYKGISDRARDLLSREEGLDVEFKQSIDSLDITDILSFANSPYGGTILVGIREVHTRDGGQRGEVYGAPVGDRAKMQIVQKVNAIIPQLTVDIIVENAARKPFYRIEIPSGPNKPYCSTSGIYKIRDDGYSKPLLPATLVAMVMETQAQRFYERFERASRKLEEEITTVSNRAQEELDGLEEAVGSLNRKTDAILENLDIPSPEAVPLEVTIKRVQTLLHSSGVTDKALVERILEPLKHNL